MDTTIEMTNVEANGEQDRLVSTKLVEPNTINLRWDNISVSTKTKKSCCGSLKSTKILHSVSGHVKSGQLLAVMGPSGSGKTTLLNVLNGRYVSEYDIEGQVSINGQASQIKIVKSLSGYVQQGDCFVPMLTVREFLSLVRMDKNVPQSDRNKRIDEVLKELGLSNCASTRIGNRNDDIVGMGISGGELRRLTFAAEILTNPPLLFCDEPTSGLDSHLAESVVKILKKLTLSGRTIICTIHQPSSEVFVLFDRLLLLAQGQVAFIGSLRNAERHFSSLGLVCPTHFNPADYYLKQVSILPGQEEECKENILKICDSFANSKSEKAEMSPTNESINQVDFTSGQSVYKASWFGQFKALLWRSFISNIREPMIIRVKLTQYLTVAVLLGLIYYKQQLDQKGIMNINGAIFIVLINLTFMNVFSVVNTFCSELPLFLREHNNAMYRVDTYFLSKMISELPYQILMPTIFMVIFYPLANSYYTAYSFAMFTLIANLVSCCGISFGYMASCMSSSTKVAIALSSPLILPLLIFGGFFVNNITIPVYLQFFKYISWFYYGFESLLIVQWKDIDHIDCGPPLNTTDLLTTTTVPPVSLNASTLEEHRCLTKGVSVIEEYSFNPDNLYLDLIALILIIFVLRMVAFLFLLRKSYKR